MRHFALLLGVVIAGLSVPTVRGAALPDVENREALLKSGSASFPLGTFFTVDLLSQLNRSIRPSTASASFPTPTRICGCTRIPARWCRKTA